jgi:alpha-ribazole phosphatase/probable phosphoglycerate mutase
MEKLNRLYLVRHGQVVGFDELRANGHTDVEITETGKIQMESLASRLRLAGIKAIYSSDLKRAVMGARIIGRHHDVNHNIMPELREVYFGDWEGMSMDEIQEEYPGEPEERYKAIINYRPPGKGESMRDLSERIVPCLKGILEEQNGNDILIVAHGGVNRVILCHALGLDIANLFNIYQDYGCLNIIDYYPNHPIVRLING